MPQTVRRADRLPAWTVAGPAGRIVCLPDGCRPCWAVAYSAGRVAGPGCRTHADSARRTVVPAGRLSSPTAGPTPASPAEPSSPPDDRRPRRTVVPVRRTHADSARRTAVLPAGPTPTRPPNRRRRPSAYSASQPGLTIPDS